MKFLQNSTVIAERTSDRDELDSERFKKTYYVFRLDKMFHDQPWDYSGIFYSNSFRVSRPISLLSIGFFGPYYDKNAIYQVNVQVERLDENRNNIIRNVKESIRGEKGKSLMYIDFNDPVRILANTWYTIKFQLDGPPTFRGGNNSVQMTERPEVGEEIDFYFYWGSQQMPCLKYSLL